MQERRRVDCLECEMNSVSDDARMRSTAFSEERDFKRAAVFLLTLTRAGLGNGKLNRAFKNDKTTDYRPTMSRAAFSNDRKITRVFTING